jgi:hypothetical protein
MGKRGYKDLVFVCVGKRGYGDWVFVRGDMETGCL